MIICNLLNFIKRLVAFILGDLMILFHPLDLILRMASYIADTYASLFRHVLCDLDQLHSPLFGQWWNIYTDYLAVINGCQAQIGSQNSFFNSRGNVFIPRLNDYVSRIGCAERTYLFQWQL